MLLSTQGHPFAFPRGAWERGVGAAIINSLCQYRCEPALCFPSIVCQLWAAW